MRLQHGLYRQPPQGQTKELEPIYETEKGFISITFDDGPTMITEQILDVLRQKNSKALFFMIGKQIEEFPGVVSRIIAEGHFIGNHTFAHPYMTNLSTEEQEQEIVRTNEIIKSVTGVSPSYFRPPFGAFNETTLELVHKHNMKLMMWSADPRDYTFNTDDVLFRTVEPLLSSRSILLLHDLKRPSADALPKIIDSIRERELRITEVY